MDSNTEDTSGRPRKAPRITASGYREKVLSQASDRRRTWLEAQSPLVDRDVVLEAVALAGDVLQYASEELRGDKEVVMTAVRKDIVRRIYSEPALQYASLALRDDKEVVLAAVSHNHCLSHASYNLRGDKEVLMAAVSHHGIALMYASGICRDKEIVMAAVATWGLALEFASNELCGDKEVVLAAVSTHCLALDFISHELHSDVSFVAQLMHCATVEHGPLKYRGIRKYFPTSGRKLRKLFGEVLHAVNCWRSCVADVAPELFESRWVSLLAEAQWYVSLALPDACKHVMEFSGIKEDYSLVVRLREFDPVIRVLMDCPTHSWIDQANQYVLWYDDCENDGLSNIKSHYESKLLNGLDC